MSGVVLVCLAADKGSPGVTTTAMSLASEWPREAVVAELDPAGGDLLYRAVGERGEPLDPSTGVLSLAAEARRPIPPERVLAHTQRLHGGVRALAGIQTPAQVGALAGMWPSLGQLLDRLPAMDVLADCGRLGPDAPATTLEAAAHAAVLLLVCRAEVEQVAHLRDRVAELAGARLDRPLPPLGVVLIADKRSQRDSAAQVTRLLDRWRLPAVVVGTLPVDPVAAAYLCGRLHGSPPATSLGRAARALADQLAAGLPGPYQPAPRRRPVGHPQPVGAR